MSNQKQLSDLVAGDRCCYRTSGYVSNDRLTPLKVDRVTPSGRIVTSDGYIWNPDGSLRGAGEWSRISNLKPITDELQAQITKQAQVSRLSSVDWDKIPDDCRHSIISVLNTKGESLG